jgi:hypothetical protein
MRRSTSPVSPSQTPLLSPLTPHRQLGDCHSLNCLHEWYPNVSNITVTKYGFEMLELFNPDRLAHEFPGMEPQLFGHSPDSANEWDFWPVSWGEKKTDVKMFGFTGSCRSLCRPQTIYWLTGMQSIPCA